MAVIFWQMSFPQILIEHVLCANHCSKHWRYFHDANILLGITCNFHCLSLISRISGLALEVISEVAQTCFSCLNPCTTLKIPAKRFLVYFALCHPKISSLPHKIIISLRLFPHVLIKDTQKRRSPEKPHCLQIPLYLHILPPPEYPQWQNNHCLPRHLLYCLSESSFHAEPKHVLFCDYHPLFLILPSKVVQGETNSLLRDHLLNIFRQLIHLPLVSSSLS